MADKIEDFWNPEFWKQWEAQVEAMVIDPRRTPYDHVEVGASPIRTEHGWLLIYSHISNYFENPDHDERVFGVEALLLDLDDPRKIIGRSAGPLFAPEEPYEFLGTVPNIVFPTCALLDDDGDTLSIYYGAADTTGCYAQVSVSDLISSISPKMEGRWYLKRFAGNPVLTPRPEHHFEAQAVFNPAAIDLGGKVHLLYRALSNDNTSTIGYASSKDGFSIDERLPEPIYVPREPFETKKIEMRNSGCEDPRLSLIDDRIYMCYTAFDGIGPPRVAVSSIDKDDFLAKKFEWSKSTIITPRGVDDKDTCILPETVNGKYLILHRIDTDICGDYLDSLDFSKDFVKKCIRVLGPRVGRWDSVKVGITAPPLKTDKGWLLLYHAVSKKHHTYRVGAALLDLKDPTVVISRSSDPIFEPKEDYEKGGIVPNVVFPCGMLVRENILYVYYGGGDKVVGVATMELDILLNALVRGEES